MSTVTIYGASDDLVEIEGDLREEFYAMDDEGFSLAFGDGTIIDARYDNSGMWRFTRGYAGSAEFTKEEALGEEGRRPDSDIPAYSDVITLTGDLKWVFSGEKVSLHKIGAESTNDAARA